MILVKFAGARDSHISDVQLVRLGATFQVRNPKSRVISSTSHGRGIIAGGLQGRKIVRFEKVAVPPRPSLSEHRAGGKHDALRLYGAIQSFSALHQHAHGVCKAPNSLASPRASMMRRYSSIGVGKDNDHALGKISRPVHVRVAHYCEVVGDQQKRGHGGYGIEHPGNLVSPTCVVGPIGKRFTIAAREKGPQRMAIDRRHIRVYNP